MPLDFEKITLNAIPDGDMPVFHASQFETMRPFIADLKWGTEDFAPGEDNWCTLSIRKNDDTLVIIDDIDIDTNTVSCILSQQAVACVGDNFCQLKVWGTEADEDGCIACLNFILHVQPDPEAGGLTSESEINNLTQQIEDIAHEVIGEDYYDKSEVDALLAAKADSNSVYTKAETDTLLSAKANTADLATVATTGDYDDLINKPVIPVQVQSDYAQEDSTQVDYIKNKPDIDAMIAAALLAVMPVGTESGPIASFDTEIAAPLVNVSCDIVATGGNGTPENPNPINGYTEANITANGDVITIAFGQTVYGGVLDVTRGKLTGTKKDKLCNGSESWQGYTTSSDTITFALTNAVSDILNQNEQFSNMFTYNANAWDASRNIPNTFVLGTSKTLFVQVSISDYPDTNSFKTFLSNNNLNVVYNCTPFDIDLTPEVISAVVGTNNVYSDTNGDTTVQYKDSIQHYIDTRV